MHVPLLNTRQGKLDSLPLAPHCTVSYQIYYTSFLFKLRFYMSKTWPVLFFIRTSALSLELPPDFSKVFHQIIEQNRMAFRTAQDVEASINAQIASPPSISLQILGTHMVSEQIQVDFDLWIDYTKDVKVTSGEFLTSDESGIRSWSQQQLHEADFLATSRGWVEDWLSDDNRKKYNL